MDEPKAQTTNQKKSNKNNVIHRYELCGQLSQNSLIRFTNEDNIESKVKYRKIRRKQSRAQTLAESLRENIYNMDVVVIQ